MAKVAHNQMLGLLPEEVNIPFQADANPAPGNLDYMRSFEKFASMYNGDPRVIDSHLQAQLITQIFNELKTSGGADPEYLQGLIEQIKAFT